MFAGFLLLDAWVGNQDRHDQNWAVVRRSVAPGELRLAASYDHASSIGFNLRDSYREAQLRSGGMQRFAAKARAHRFEHDPSAGPAGIPTLVDRAAEALLVAGSDARSYWLDRLASISPREVDALVARVPELSDLTRTFIVELLRINRERLLDECR